MIRYQSIFFSIIISGNKAAKKNVKACPCVNKLTVFLSPRGPNFGAQNGCSFRPAFGAASHGLETNKNAVAALFIVYLERARPSGETASDSRSRLGIQRKMAVKKLQACLDLKLWSAS